MGATKYAVPLWTFHFPNVASDHDANIVMAFLDNLAKLTRVDIAHGVGLFIACCDQDVLTTVRNLATGEDDGSCTARIANMKPSDAEAVAKLAEAAAKLKQASLRIEYYHVIQCSTDDPDVAEILRRFGEEL